MSSSIGVFREGEINGKPFHIFTFLSQTDNLSSSSSSSSSSFVEAASNSDLFPPQTLFFCPAFRLKVEKLKLKELGYTSDDDVLPFNTPPYFPSISSSVDQQVQSLLDSESTDDNDDDDDDDDDDTICKLPLLPLFWCNIEKPNAVDSYLNCRSCLNPEIGTGYYLCPTCDGFFHKECVEAPLEIKHPSYPFLSLQLYTPPRSHYEYWRCICCRIAEYDMAYHCPIYNVSMHQVCLMKPIPILIDHLKRHPHSLTFFPKQDSLLCNVCGVIKELIPTYVCARCVFVVHQDCIYFPYVISISRHQHRISFTYSLPSRKLSCGVCRRKVDKDCGAYSCSKCKDYVVHSRCALRIDLWDGEELEEVPEEPEIVVDPFKRIDEGIILHFSHGHHLKLDISRVYEDGKLCQACVLPIYEGDYYSCVDQCDFILHEECASSPIKKHHPLHAHPLTLKVVTNGYRKNKGEFRCDACRRNSGGFVYEGPPVDWCFRLDLRCASVSEPFEYEGHEHPLFLALTREEEESSICQICQDTGALHYCKRKLNCIECDYIICFNCATLPYKARYKHDEHLLTFREGKKGKDESGWCEVCEQKMVYSRSRGFYACDDYCCTTLHVYCLLGTDPYMKHGQTIDINGDEVHILRNNTMSRPSCYGSKCDEDRCPYRVLFEKKNMTFCSYYCAITRI